MIDKGTEPMLDPDLPWVDCRWINCCDEPEEIDCAFCDKFELEPLIITGEQCTH